MKYEDGKATEQVVGLGADAVAEQARRRRERKLE